MPEGNPPKYTFYDPHNGINGAVIPLPKPLGKAVSELENFTSQLPEALQRLNLAIKESEQLGFSDQRIIVSEKHSCLFYDCRDPEGIQHAFRLLRFV